MQGKLGGCAKSDEDCGSSEAEGASMSAAGSVELTDGYARSVGVKQEQREGIENPCHWEGPARRLLPEPCFFLTTNFFLPGVPSFFGVPFLFWVLFIFTSSSAGDEPRPARSSSEPTEADQTRFSQQNGSGRAVGGRMALKAFTSYRAGAKACRSSLLASL
jgi:hypothetical protein